MARIIICSLSNVTWTKEKHLDSFVEGFATALKRSGNEVLSLRVNDFAVGDVSLVHEDQASAALKAFQPDLLVTFNNVFPYRQILDDLDCPIACFASDSLAFFSNKDLMRKYVDRYTFFNFSNDTISAFPQWFPYVQKHQIVRFGQATDLRAVNLEQDIDISFIGSIANWNRSLVDYFKSFHEYRVKHGNAYCDENVVKEHFFEALEAFRKNPLSTFDYTLPGFKPPVGSMETTAILLLTCQSRFNVLSSLTDLGLKVFSVPYAFADVLLYNPELFKAFDFETSVTMDHSTRNYNRSKISLNLPHAHASEGFSWRVCDILASNATLLSCRQPDLIKLTKDYIKLPTYESPAEARDLAQKLLKDAAWRKELTLGSQQAIEDNCRFEAKFKLMEDAIPGLKLLPTTKKASTGSFEFFDEQLYIRKNRFRIIEMVRKWRMRRAARMNRPAGKMVLLVKRVLKRIFLALT